MSLWHLQKDSAEDTLTLVTYFTHFIYTTNTSETYTENTQLKLSPGEQLMTLPLSAILCEK